MMRDTVIKYVPFSSLEFDIIEAWLEELALEGLELTDILSGRFAKFKRTAPRKVRYRLGRPDCEAQTKREAEYLIGCKELGWEFVAILGSDYYIFRTEDENAVEFYTDKTVLERGMTRRIRWEIIGALVHIVVGLLLSSGFFYYLGFGGPIVRMVEDGFGIFPFGFLVILLPIVFWAVHIAFLMKRRKRLRSGAALAHSAHLYRYGKVRVTAFAVLIVIVMIWFGYALVSHYQNNHAETHLIYEYDYSYPFPLLSEISTGELDDTETDVNQNSSGSGSGTVTFERTELAPVIIKVYQRGTTAGAGYTRYTYTVDCYELRSEKLAEKYFDGKAADLSDGGETQALTCDGLDEIQYAVGGGWYGQTLLIRRGNVVLKIWYTGDRDLADCLGLYAARLAP